MVPDVLRRAMHTWSCLTKRGRVLLLSPVFLSTIQIKACKGYRTSCKWGHSPEIKSAGLDLHHYSISAQILNVKKQKNFAAITVICTSSMQCGYEELHCNPGRWLTCVQWWLSEIAETKAQLIYSSAKQKTWVIIYTLLIELNYWSWIILSYSGIGLQLTIIWKND